MIKILENLFCITNRHYCKNIINLKSQHKLYQSQLILSLWKFLGREALAASTIAAVCNTLQMFGRFLLSKWIQVSLCLVKGPYHHSVTQVQPPCRGSSRTCGVTCRECQGLFFIRSWEIEDKQLHC